MSTFTKQVAFFLAIFLAMLNAFPSAAKITGFSAPSKVLNPGQHVTVTFYTEDFIDQNLQFYAAFGVSPGYYGVALGEYGPTGYDLVANGHSDTGHGSFGVLIKLPSDLIPTKTTAYTLNVLVYGAVCARS
jgi:hypothetical protein